MCMMTSFNGICIFRAFGRLLFVKLRACIPVDTMAYVQTVFGTVTTCIADLLVFGLVLHCCLHKRLHYDPICTTTNEVTSARCTLLGEPSARAAEHCSW